MARALKAINPPVRFEPLALADQVAETLRASLRQGVWSNHLPAERSLAHWLKASRPIIRRALHILQEKGLIEIVRGHRARIVLHSVESNETGRSRKVILLMSDSFEHISHWSLAVIDALREELYHRDFQLEVLAEPRLKQKKPAVLLDRIRGEHESCRWILGGASAFIQEWFQEQQMPVVMMGNTYPGIAFPFVNSDLHGVSRHAAARLLGLGHRSIVLLAREMGSAGDVSRIDGFLEAFKYHPEASPSVVRHSGRVEQIEARLGKLFSGTKGPSALLVTHALDLIVIFLWLARRGVRVPGDLSLICLQWEKHLEYLRPLPAWYYNDPGEHARKLCRLITKPGHGRLPAHFILPRFSGNETIARKS